MRQRGFSLMEVLVAFSVLALALGVTMRIHSGALKNVETAHAQAGALSLAQSLLAQGCGETPLAAREASGLVDDRYEWRIAVAPYHDEHAPNRATIAMLWEVDVMVAWRDSASSRPRSVSLRSLRAQAQATQ
jgi:general secretion pathway protein I